MPTPTPTAVVFDFGGVLITPITNLLAEIAEWHDVTMEAALAVLMGPPDESLPDHPWHRCERGEIAMADMQRDVVPWAQAAGISLRGDEYERLLCGEFNVHDDVVARIEQLRADGYHTGLLTNSFLEFRAVLESKVDFALFDTVVDSSEVGHRKPEPVVYELTTTRVGAPAEQIVYLDDFLANVEGAQQAGWTTIHVTDIPVALRELDELLAG
jgi:putative hydrolase of the HAD superfamily